MSFVCQLCQVGIQRHVNHHRIYTLQVHEEIHEIVIIIIMQGLHVVYQAIRQFITIVI